MVIGGQAVLLYGEPRLTKDIDITLGVGIEHLSDVISVAAKSDLKCLVDAESFTRKTMVLPCQDLNTGIRVDFIFSFSLYEKQAIQRARKVKLGNKVVHFASLEDLIIHKMIAGRPRDLEDIHGLLLKNPNVDLSYIRNWLREFSNSLREPFSDRFNDLLKRSRVSG
jgi:hypothetical protein